MKRHRTEVQVRVADTDRYGHVNNASYATYAELGRLDFWKAIGGSIGEFILAHLCIDFRRQVSYGDSVHVETWLEKIGRSSATLRQDVCANDAVAAEIRSVIVHFDYEAGTSLELKPDMRERAQEYLS